MDDMFLPRASLHPPIHADADPAYVSRPSWILLDFRACFADRRNATTATCMTRCNKEIQVTFFPAHPPRVSYFCVHCSGVGPDGFVEEPKLIATDAKFALLRISIGQADAILCESVHDYYIYCADGAPDGGPSLELLPHPYPYSFHDNQVGLLSHGTGYTIAALRDDSSAFFRATYEPGHYEVCLLNSGDKVWTSENVFVPPDQERYTPFDEGFYTNKVVTVGGEHGTMAFVDLWHGILLYDVFRRDTKLRYVTLPEKFCPETRPQRSPWITRDIAVVKGRIKFVEIVMKVRQGARVVVDFISDGWVASMWSRKATFPQEDSWIEDCKIEASDVEGESSQKHLEMLRTLPQYEGKPWMTWERLHIGHPTLSLDSDGVVYFMTKVNHREKKAWVIAVDMRLRMLQEVAEFDAKRTFGISFTYTHSRISKFLNMDPEMKGVLKRPGLPLPGSCSKKLSGASSAASVEAEEEDDMI